MRPSVVPPLDANILWFSELDSTNLAAARLVASWDEEVEDRLQDTVIVAGSQSAGRGRSDHSWASPAGGLYATWLGWIETELLAWLPLAAGVCVAEAIEAAVPGVRALLKWPNDIIMCGRKAGGVLCQSRSRGHVVWAAVGVGVNVEVTPVVAPVNATLPTCLREQGLAGKTDDAIWCIVAGMVRRMRGTLADSTELRRAWLARCVHGRREPLRVRSGGEVVIGAFAGLSADAQLELEVDGALMRFAAAELVSEMRQPPGPPDAEG